MTGMADDRTASRDPLLADVTEMARQAAIDGLALAAVFADLRLVLELGPGEDLPADVLRACASAWSHAHEGSGRVGEGSVLSWDELEDRLWESSADPSMVLPRWAVVLGAVTRPSDDARSMLSAADVLRGAADLVASRLEGSGEHLALVLAGTDDAGDGLLVVVTDDLHRARHLEGWLRDLGLEAGGAGGAIHSLTDHPDGLLAALRRAIATGAPDL